VSKEPEPWYKNGFVSAHIDQWIQADPDATDEEIVESVTSMPPLDRWQWPKTQIRLLTEEVAQRRRREGARQSEREGSKPAEQSPTFRERRAKDIERRLGEQVRRNLQETGSPWPTGGVVGREGQQEEDLPPNVTPICRKRGRPRKTQREFWALPWEAGGQCGLPKDVRPTTEELAKHYSKRERGGTVRYRSLTPSVARSSSKPPGSGQRDTLLGRGNVDGR
jgi:hypothetical protein